MREIIFKMEMKIGNDDLIITVYKEGEEYSASVEKQ